jgi:DNA-binding transcriptional MerR regulator
MEKNSIKQLLMTSNFYVLNKQLVKSLGIETAFFLTALVEADETLADDEGWFYQTSKTLEEITGLSNHKQTKCIEQLISLGILLQENKGVPMKRYFKLNYDQILKFLNTRIEKTSNQELKKVESKSLKNLKTSFQKNSNNKEYNINNLDKELNIKTTTKLDNLNKIDQDSKDSSTSSSSSLVENSSSKEKDTIYQIKSALQSHGISIDTCKNIMELVRNGRVDLDRIKSVLITAQQKAWGEGAIYKALRDNWEAGASETKTISEKELRKKLAGKANMLLDDYEKGRIEYDTMIENYIEFCSNPIFTEALKIEYYDKIKKAAEKTLVKTA